MGWSTDWPFAGIHLMIRVSELTKTRISRDLSGKPSHWTVRLTDDALFQCPFTTASDVGTLQFSPEEALRLREYLLKGGFLWVDDFWGTAAWNQWSSEIHRVLPEFPIVEVAAGVLLETVRQARCRAAPLDGVQGDEDVGHGGERNTV